MAKCKDCLHYCACVMMYEKTWGEPPKIGGGDGQCDTFAERSKYVVREKGEWATDEEVVYRYGSFVKRRYCTNCGESPKFDRETGKYILTKFCPNCGADMRKGENG